MPERLDLAALFPEAAEVWLEIGFGAGEHLAELASANPEIGMLGCEHYLAGVASALSRFEKAALGSIRVHKGDARDLMDALDDGAIVRALLLYPDPWPKTRHHKRRFVNDETVECFARILRDGGELRVATDIPDYADWTRAHLARSSAFEPVHDAREPWEGWPGTRYEAKALRERREPQYLIYRRRGR